MSIKNSGHMSDQRKKHTHVNTRAFVDKGIEVIYVYIYTLANRKTTRNRHQTRRDVCVDAEERKREAFRARRSAALVRARVRSKGV